ncbi:hypothetical protein COHA_001861 [Chlorella ohadii]|uniref:DUF1990 domain-containing protein n=1 Tax=Chlorella ohadii TaxID=2649997 RepID=A0AAD5DUC1_9CHLO|nr:hypothetical protein COHA_001861 [Chlorella ohadii]
MPALQIGPFFLGRPSREQQAAVEASASSTPFSFPHVGVTRTAPPLPEAVAAEGWTLDHNRVQVGRGRAAYRKAQRLLEQWRHFDLGWASVNAPPVKQGAPVVVTARTLLCWSCNPLRISYVEEGALRRTQLQPWAGAKCAAAGGKASKNGSSSKSSSSSKSGSGSNMANAAKAASGGSSAAPSSTSGSGDPLTRLLGALARGAGTRAAQQQQAVAEARPPRGRRYAFAHTTLAGHQISGEERFAVAWNHEDDSVWYEIYTLSRPGSWITAATHPLLRAFQRKFAADSMAAMQREMLKP